MCTRFASRGAIAPGRLTFCLLAALLVALAGFSPAWAAPNPSIGGVDCNLVRTNAQTTVSDPPGDVFGSPPNCPNPVNYGFDYGMVSVWLDTATDNLYFCIGTYGNIGDSDQDGGYNSKSSVCGGNPGCVNIEADPFLNIFAAETEKVTVQIDRDCDGVIDLLFTLTGATQTKADSVSVTIDVLPGHASLTGSTLGGRGVAWAGEPIQPGPDVVCVASREGAVLVKIANWRKYFTVNGLPGGDIVPGVSPTLFEWVVDSGNNSDFYTEDLVSGSFDISDPAIDITKTASPTALCANGSTTLFTINVTNTGNTPLTNVTVTDLLPVGLAYVALSGNPAPTSVVGPLITWDGSISMSPGATRTFTFQAGKTAECQGTVTDTAQVVATFYPACYVNHGVDPVPLSDLATFDVLCQAACVLVNVPDNTDNCVGQTVNVPVTVTNCATVAENIRVTTTVDGVPIAPQSFPDVAAGGTRTFDVPVTCSSEGRVLISATATAAVAGTAECTDTKTDDGVVNCVPCGGACPHTIGFWRQQCDQKGNGSTKVCKAGMENLWRCVINTTGVLSWKKNDGQYTTTVALKALSNAVLFDSLCTELQGPRPMTLRDMTEIQYLGLMLNVCAGALPTTIEIDNNFQGTVAEAIAGIEHALNTDTDLGYWEMVADNINNRIGVLAADCPEGDDLFRNLPPCTVAPGAPGSGELGGPALDLNAGRLLSRAYPNPASLSGTVIEYVLPATLGGGPVDVAVYDLTGRLVKRLVSEPKDSGRYTVEWNLRDESGSLVPTGVYFYRVAAGGQQQSEKLLVIRQ